MAEIVAKARGYQKGRGKGYREQALKLFPHVCARCAKEFEGAAMRELTVHHKDHNHDNNPPDGSNWELLCVYCHDDEHQDAVQREGSGNTGLGTAEPTLGFNAFEGLKGILGDSEDQGRSAKE
ncbi:MAG: YajD family HNH nuclease [Candidatus Hydrogenedentes bacterium]|nr:YajD family HNH nuclease [Candidatus Hydrogenedentota bacterium]